MITSMHVENFKCFERLDLPDVSRVTLIGGRNNIGKTCLLEAIFMFYDNADPSMFIRHLAWRGIAASSADPDTLVAPAFRDFNVDHQIKITISDGIYHGTMVVKFNPSHTQKTISIDLADSSNTNLQVRTDQEASISYALDIHYQIDGQPERKTSLVVRQSPTSLNIQFDPHPISSFPEGMMHGAVYLGLQVKVPSGENVGRFGQLDVEKRIDQIIAFLKVLEPNLEGLSAVTLLHQQPIVYADIGLNRKIPVAYMGDGMNRLLSIILAIATTKNGVVLIDEIDAGIHHSIMAKVWEGICRAARQFNCQIIATTHSYECVQAAYDGVAQAEMAREFRYIRLDRVDTAIEGKTYTHEILGAALEHGWEVR